MKRTTLYNFAAVAALGVTLPAGAVIFSPSQADLLGLTSDVTVPFGGGGSLFGTFSSGTGVELELDFGVGGDTISRVVVENDTFTGDLSGFDGFDLLFESKSLNQNLQVKSYLRTGAGDFYESTTTTANFGNQVRVPLNLGGLANLNDVTGFGLQMFEPAGASPGGVLAQLETAPQRPVVTTKVISSFETPDDLGTPGVNEQLENWTEGFQPDHTHSIGTAGATDGSSVLRIDRAKGPSDPTFRWGSQLRFTSDTESTDPDTAIVPQSEIDEIINVLNSTNAKVAFDVYVDPADVDTTGVESAFLGFGLSINSGTAGFTQSPQQFVNGDNLLLTDPITLNYEVPASDFGALPTAGDGFLAFTISTNTDVPGIYSIDNFRVIAEGVAEGILGDYNDSGQVEQGDLDLVLQNWGLDTDANGVPAGWTNDLPSGQIEQTELDGVLQNWGNTAAPDFSGSSVPEPAALSVLGLAALAGRRRHR